MKAGTYKSDDDNQIIKRGANVIYTLLTNKPPCHHHNVEYTGTCHQNTHRDMN
jgi:hypothetical protein